MKCMEQPITKEVSLDRHKVRLREDPEYWKVWGTDGRLSIVIPTYSRNPALIQMEIKHATEWRKHCDELIICEDGGEFSQELKDIATEYMYHPNVGVCENMNLGWALALKNGAKFVVIMDSDVSYVEGNLRDLCIPGKVTVPQVIEFPHSSIIAPMLCVAREVALERGLYHCGKDYRNEGFDPELYERVKDIFEGVHSVKVSHRGPLGVIGGATRFGNVF